MFGRLDALGRFFLERMDDPNLIAELHSIHHAKRIATKREGNLEYPRTQAMHGLRDVGLAALRGDRQSGETDRFRLFRELSNSLSAALIHEMGRVLRGTAIGPTSSHILIRCCHI